MTLPSSRPRAARLALGALLAAAAVTGLSACGSSSSSSSQSLKVTEKQSGKTFAFTGVKPIKGGTVTIDFTNSAKGGQHEIQLAKVDGTHSQAEVEAALKKVTAGPNGSLAAFLHPAGGVSNVNPGQSAKATVTLTPGRYYAVDTDTGQGNNAPPYFSQGAIQAFEVKTGTGGSLPSAQSTVTIKDKPGDKFEFVNSNLKAGKSTLELDNQSKKEFHHVQVLPLLPGKTVADVKKVLASQGPPKGPPPVNFEAGQGTSVVEHGSKIVSDVNLKPGNYVMLCFVTDRDGKGPPHFGKGLLKEVKVS
jgi:uncharacterized cupredoxin-like copper-binding protein